MNSLKQVQQWLQDMKFAMDIEEDTMERTEMSYRVKHIENNLQHYITPKLKKGESHFFCKECGEIEFATYTNKSKLLEHQLCFGCNLWQEREEEYLRGKKPILIVKGCVYTDGGNTFGRSTQYNGFGGAKFNIRMLDGSKEWGTNNLWCGGNIPKKYRLTTMKDNAEFVKGVV